MENIEVVEGYLNMLGKPLSPDATWDRCTGELYGSNFGAYSKCKNPPTRVILGSLNDVVFTLCEYHAAKWLDDSVKRKQLWPIE